MKSSTKQSIELLMQHFPNFVVEYRECNEIFDKLEAERNRWLDLKPIFVLGKATTDDLAQKKLIEHRILTLEKELNTKAAKTIVIGKNLLSRLEDSFEKISSDQLPPGFAHAAKISLNAVSHMIECLVKYFESKDKIQHAFTKTYFGGLGSYMERLVTTLSVELFKADGIEGIH